MIFIVAITNRIINHQFYTFKNDIKTQYGQVKQISVSDYSAHCRIYLDVTCDENDFEQIETILINPSIIFLST